MAYGSSAFGSESYGGSSNVILVGTITFTLDAKLLMESILKTFTLDARIVFNRTGTTFILDAEIVERITTTFTLDASLQKEFTKTFTVDASLQKGLTKTFSLDSRLVFRREITSSITAVLQKTFKKTFTIGARVYVIVKWLSPWKCRKKLNIVGGSVIGTNIVIQFNVHKGSGTDSSSDVFCNNCIKDDFTDLRFTDSDGNRLIRYQIVSYVSGDVAVVNVEVPYIPTSPDSHDIYMYYNNSSASSIGVSLTYTTTKYLLKTINLNNTIPPGTGSSCVVFFDQVYNDSVPNFTEAWVAKMGLSTYDDVVTNGSSNGIGADDIWALKINEIQAFAVYIVSSVTCPLFPLTDVLGSIPPYISKNISDNLSNLIGEYVDFRVQFVNTIGLPCSGSSGAVYIFGISISDLISTWGIQENLNRIRNICRTHRVGLRIFNG